MRNIDCRLCVHCTNLYCEVYGDDVDYTMNQCKEENFIHYREKE